MRRKRRSFRRKVMPYVVAGAVGIGAHAGLRAIENKPILVKPKVSNVIGAVALADAARRLVKKKGSGRKAVIGVGAGVGAVHPGLAVLTDAVVAKQTRQAAVRGAKWVWERKWRKPAKRASASKKAVPPRRRIRQRRP